MSLRGPACLLLLRPAAPTPSLRDATMCSPRHATTPPWWRRTGECQAQRRCTVFPEGEGNAVSGLSKKNVGVFGRAGARVPACLPPRPPARLAQPLLSGGLLAAAASASRLVLFMGNCSSSSEQAEAAAPPAAAEPAPPTAAEPEQAQGANEQAMGEGDRCGLPRPPPVGRCDRSARRRWGRAHSCCSCRSVFPDERTLSLPLQQPAAQAHPQQAPRVRQRRVWPNRRLPQEGAPQGASPRRTALPGCCQLDKPRIARRHWAFGERTRLATHATRGGSRANPRHAAPSPQPR